MFALLEPFLSAHRIEILILSLGLCLKLGLKKIYLKVKSIELKARFQYTHVRQLTFFN